MARVYYPFRPADRRKYLCRVSDICEVTQDQRQQVQKLIDKWFLREGGEHGMTSLSEGGISHDFEGVDFGSAKVFGPGDN